METGFVIIYVIFLIFGSLIGLLFMGFWIWMLVDAIQHETDEDNQKILWILVTIFGGWIGGLVYMIVRRQPRRKAEGKTGLF